MKKRESLTLLRRNNPKQNPKLKNVFQYVIPTVLSQCAFFLFSIIDDIFVGNGVSTDALGAVNLALPIILVVSALFMMTIIGGVTVTAIRIGRKDNEGANAAFMHSVLATTVVGAVFTVIGVFFTEQVAVLLGARGDYVQLVCDYLF